jgi:hypothetical protein
MFDSSSTGCLTIPGPADGDVARVAGWSDILEGDLAAADDPARLRLIRELERLKCAAAAAQAVLAVAFDESQRQRQAAEGVPRAQLGRGVASELAFARRESPHRGQRGLGLAKILHGEMPHTLAAFRAGAISEWAAMIMVRENGVPRPAGPPGHRRTARRES